jgi:Transglycosylase SLT domain
VQYARALGPMQFLPGTWARFASDGDGDGKADVQNIYDASLAAARYLCSGGLNLRDQAQVMAAVLRYNNSMPYAQNVLGWAAAYATGVVPVDLPPITAVPPMGDAHLEGSLEGIGPGAPLNAIGLPSTDPLALWPVQFGSTDIASQMSVPGQGPAQSPICPLICYGQQQADPMLPPWMQPPTATAPNGLTPDSPPEPFAGPAPLGPLPGPAPLGPLPGPAPVPPTQYPGPVPLPGSAPVPPTQYPGPVPLPGAPPASAATPAAPGPALAPGPAPAPVPAMPPTYGTLPGN